MILVLWCIDYDFAIKCGGPQIRSSENVVFEGDNKTLGPATYYVTESERWAVSNVGLFAESTDPKYTTSSSNQFTNTLDSELFQTARISPGSLRYYGLGLENGNYAVTLRFAEMAFDPNMGSHGRRVFDIYIQVKYWDLALFRNCGFIWLNNGCLLVCLFMQGNLVSTLACLGSLQGVGRGENIEKEK